MQWARDVSAVLCEECYCCPEWAHLSCQATGVSPLLFQYIFSFYPFYSYPHFRVLSFSKSRFKIGVPPYWSVQNSLWSARREQFLLGIHTLLGMHKCTIALGLKDKGWLLGQREKTNWSRIEVKSALLTHGPPPPSDSDSDITFWGNGRTNVQKSAFMH